ncbi:MAG: hypothetical protein IH584_09415 [Candidatus Aminicenantes bacterium]|nr:hypothetical protein [Candidatus Aminicenantes bacterium]
MSQSDLLKKIVGILAAREIPYMLTGSLVSSIQGEPRSTHDIDIIISIRPSDIPGIVQAFPAEEFYLDPESITSAVKTQGMFNVIDLREGDNVDFWMLTESEFDRSRFSRRQEFALLGENVWLSSAEDTILAKLRWSELCGGSRKHYLDALKVYEVQYPQLNMEYLNDWVRQLHLTAPFNKLIGEAKIIL